MLTIILYVLGFIMLYRLAQRDGTTPDGKLKKRLNGAPHYVAAIFWPVCAAYIAYDAVMDWIESKRTRA